MKMATRLSLLVSLAAIAPLPIVSYQIQRVTISALWIPYTRQYVSGAIGTFATVSIK